jgi:hypothetical protein
MEIEFCNKYFKAQESRRHADGRSTCRVVFGGQVEVQTGRVTATSSLILLLLLLLLLLFIAIELSLGSSSPYTQTKQIRINIHKRNSTKTQYKQYKTQQIQVHILSKHPRNFQCTHTSQNPHIHTFPCFVSVRLSRKVSV